MDKLLKDKRFLLSFFPLAFIIISFFSYPIYDFTETNHEAINLYRLASMYLIYFLSGEFDKRLEKRNAMITIIMVVLSASIGLLVFYIINTNSNLLTIENIGVHIFTFLLMAFLGALLNVYKIKDEK